jgi:hypothetical protein
MPTGDEEAAGEAGEDVAEDVAELAVTLPGIEPGRIRIRQAEQITIERGATIRRWPELGRVFLSPDLL